MAEQSFENEMTSTTDAIRQGKDKAVDEVKSAVRDAARQQKVKAAEGLSGFAGALRRTAEDVGGESETLGRYADMAAQQLDRFSQTLRNRDIDELVVEAENFARRQPTLFIGTAMAAGFLMARFLKSSPRAGYGRTTTSSVGATSSYSGAGYGAAGYTTPAMGSDIGTPGGSAI